MDPRKFIRMVNVRLFAAGFLLTRHDWIRSRSSAGRAAPATTHNQGVILI
jgi:hypothetical protein